MEEKKITSVINIINKIEKVPKMAKLFIAIGDVFVLLTVLGVFLYLNDKDYGMFLIIIGMILAFLFLAYGLFQLFVYKRRTKGVNVDKAKEELDNCTSFLNEQTLFTDNYILSTYGYPLVIKYIDIVWIYKKDIKGKDGNVSKSELVIHLVDGRKVKLPYSSDFIDIIKKYNSNTFDTYSKEHKKAYKEIVSNYKKFKKTEVVEKKKEEPKEEIKVEVTTEVPTGPQPKQMLDIDPLYNLPGMVYNKEETQASTKDFLMMNSKVEEQTEVKPIEEQRVEPPTNPQQVNNGNYDVNNIKNPFVNN